MISSERMQQRCRPISSNSALDVDVSQTTPVKALCVIQSGQGPFRGFQRGCRSLRARAASTREHHTRLCDGFCTATGSSDTHGAYKTGNYIAFAASCMAIPHRCLVQVQAKNTSLHLTGSVNTYLKVSTGKNRIIQALQRATFRTGKRSCASVIS
jgi:hypothetical protein